MLQPYRQHTDGVREGVTLSFLESLLGKLIGKFQLKQECVHSTRMLTISFCMFSGP